ncbi:G-type lectin S-receptor-like serine/threonine-protein kinase SD2-2 [Cocos nucifera]|uniref:Receptor-like serine/threonine-protein kinase n=1 Tax=Cocos nucifera TaxID=13894 RepID=A0A8K0IKJ0_COCNU|nr:G-type lectin S-receptor-like serine/threonine-protein kinase SD2-2 [Cocos nucifera]
MARKAYHLLLFFLALLGAPMASELNSTIATVLIVGNTTLRSPNQTFDLGFFCPNAGVACFLAIWYASLPIRTIVWVANRAAPVPRRIGSPPPPPPHPPGLTHPDGRLAVAHSSGSLLWLSDNPRPASAVRLLDSGNLVLLSPGGATVWQSFDHPADTWLPDMAVTPSRPLVSWRSPSDPSPGLYSLRLRGGEFELAFDGSARYWSTGKWTGKLFAGVPEMTVQYIYHFSFSDPFGPNASFSYSVVSAPTEGAGPVLTRFVVDSSGQLMQYIWSPQAASWDMFWFRPAGVCRVYGRCGSLGLCVGGTRPCDCPSGFSPTDSAAWSSGDFSGGCSRYDYLCFADGFKEMGAVDLDGAVAVEISGVSRSSCEDFCRRNCSCFGLNYDSETRVCQNLYGNAYNLRNSTDSRIFFLRVSALSDSFSKESKAKWKKTNIIAISCGGFSAAILGSIVLLVIFRRKGKGGGGEDEGAFSNLKVFTYKELLAATRGFSEKLGHGSFGAVFRGELPDSSSVAVKRLERPVGGGGDREFRAEVRTIGSVHHVNLVRLRGFCSDDPHRILIYDYMPLGSLSAYLCRDRRPPLSWAARFRIAVGTARGIAYLHEECRDRIIHCDIKPENILLDADFTPKVSDFGLAKLVGRDRSRVMTAMRGTRGYVAPEWISGMAITAKADVYSYGMTLLEILRGRRNVEASVPPEAEDGWFFPHWAARRIVEGEVAAVVDPGLEEEYDGGEAERAARLAVWCIQDDEAARPAMGTVVKMLEGTVEVTVPLLPRFLEALVAGDSFPPAGGISSSWSDGRSDGRSSAGASESDRIGKAESGNSESQNLTS